MSFTSLILNVIVNLLANQIDALLPPLARWVVRRQASRMGRQSSRWEEEWLAHLEQTRGGLAQLGIALGILLVPLRIRIATRCDAAGGSWRAAVTWLHEHAWVVTVVAAALLLAAYPPDQSRYPAYGVIVPLLCLCGLYLAAPFRGLFARFFERCGYGGRVVVGSWLPLLIAYFVAAFTLVPPLDESPKRAPVASRTPKRPAVVAVPSLPIDIDRQSPRASNSTTQAIIDGGPEPNQPLAKRQTQETPPEGRRIHRLPRRGSDVPFSPLPEALNIHGPLYPPQLPVPPAEVPRLQGLESFDLTELLSLGSPQPLPSVQPLFTPVPSAPIMMRIVKEF